MKKILVTYWPKGGNVEKSAIKVQNEIGATAVLKDLASARTAGFDEYDLIIAGGSTVGAETWREASGGNLWTVFFAELAPGSLNGKKAALFGLGDQVLYPNHFVDAMAHLKTGFIKAGATLIGKWPNEGYKFTASEALEGENFVGLALDEDWQAEMTPGRIQKWVAGLLAEC